MKKFLTILLCLSSFVMLQSCEKDSYGDSYEFETLLPPYVELAGAGNRTVKQGTTDGTANKFTFQMRTALQEEVIVTYSVTGAINLPNQKISIPRNVLSAVATIAIPNNLVPTNETSVSATLTLVSATTASGRALTIGAKNKPETQKIALTITK